MKISKVQEVISGLNRFWARLCLLVAALLLVELGKATVPTRFNLSGEVRLKIAGSMQSPAKVLAEGVPSLWGDLAMELG